MLLTIDSFLADCFFLLQKLCWKKKQQIFNNSKLFSLRRRWGLHLHKLKSFSKNNVQFGWKSGSKEEDEIVKSLRQRPLERRWIDITRDTGNLFATFSIIVIMTKCKPFYIWLNILKTIVSPILIIHVGKQSCS